MKNPGKILFFITLCLLGTLLAQRSYGYVRCESSYCNFFDLTAEENKNIFYCSILSHPKKVVLEKHEVLITGFDSSGKLTLTGDKIDMLAKYYFDAKKDKSSTGTVSAISKGGGGWVSCDVGAGGRTTKWPGPYGSKR